MWILCLNTSFLLLLHMNLEGFANSIVDVYNLLIGWLTMGAHSNSNAEALLTDCPDGTSSVIADFYKNRSILITGASGFIGKQLLEKLLRSCSNLKKIYILLRDSNHTSASERLKHILSSAVRKLSFQNSLKETVIILAICIWKPCLSLTQTNLLIHC